MDSPEQIAISLNSSVVLLPVAMKGGAYKLLVLFISSKALKKSCRAASASLGLLTKLSTLKTENLALQKWMRSLNK